MKEALRAEPPPTRAAATAHRELENSYNMKLAGGADKPAIVIEDQRAFRAAKPHVGESAATSSSLVGQQCGRLHILLTVEPVHECVDKQRRRLGFAKKRQ